MPLSLYDLEQWKRMKQVVPSGICFCGGCDTKLRKRKYSTTWYEHLDDCEQPSKYCRPCLKAGHDLLFMHDYEVIPRPGQRPKIGKRLRLTEDQVVRGMKIQRKFHHVKD